MSVLVFRQGSASLVAGNIHRPLSGLENKSQFLPLIVFSCLF